MYNKHETEHALQYIYVVQYIIISLQQITHYTRYTYRIAGIFRGGLIFAVFAVN